MVNRPPPKARNAHNFVRLKRSIGLLRVQLKKTSFRLVKELQFLELGQLIEKEGYCIQEQSMLA